MENYYEKLVGLYEETKAAYDKLNGLQSALDRQVSRIYHDIEKSEFDLEKGNEYALRLKETLQNRRVVKDELKKLAPVYRMLRDNVSWVEEQYTKVVAKSYELKASLNVTKTINGVLSDIG
ncbi:hypothetical protein [Niallia taxi]|uniref:Uncharacterized protein n=1 Tax=Niallia taxi TaxID=2499688 RepID=A0A3S2TU78_9BACI|nr:hypothetical protein [Niallia taxi]RVT62783.1 hypothetical protein EM808_13675 [Niallia taxi]